MDHLPIEALEGESGYRRWKEDILLHLRTVRLSHVLFDESPADPKSSDATKWANDDALCRGHILHTLSDRLFNLFSHKTTAKELWFALERTYTVDDVPRYKTAPWLVEAFEFDKYEPILEELARFDSMAATTYLSHVGEDMYCQILCQKLPQEYVMHVAMCETRDEIWRKVRAVECAKRQRAEQQ
ncbi:hypothetical protein LUZ60_003192 [Juncus effusus]|nr:hypothetical protein LUZ60_003192 [Juncus effusus]